MSRYKNLAAIGLAAMLSFGLVACGGGSSSTTEKPPVEEPDPIDVERKAISDAIAAAQTAVAAVTDASTDDVVAAADMAVAAAMQAINGASQISAGEAAMKSAELATIQGTLTAAKASRTMTMTIAAQKMAITDALAAAQTAVDAVNDDSDDATVAAATAAVQAANAAIDAAGANISLAEATAERAKVAALRTALNAAIDDRDSALAKMDRAEAQKAALMTAAGNVDTSDLMTAEDIAAANTAIDALEAALDRAADVSDVDRAMYQAQLDAAKTAVMTAENALVRAAQTMALSDAVDDLRAVDLSSLSTQDAINAAAAAIASLRTALDDATELSAAEKAVAMTELAAANRIVMAAQGSLDLEGQKMALSEAIAALEAIDLNNLMTQEQITAAERAIIALDLALDAATGLTDAQKLDATVDVTVAKRRVDDAKKVLVTNVGNQRMALTEAGTALAALDLEDLSDQAKIDAAQAALDALKMALDGATHLSGTDKAMYQSQLDSATETVRMAQTGMDRDGRMTAQRTAIMSAVTMARTAVLGVNDTSTDSEVAAAEAAVKAVKDAIAAAEDLSDGDAEIIKAEAALTVIEPQLVAKKTSRTTYLAKKGNDDMKTDAALGKAMRDALMGPVASVGPNALDNATAELAMDLTITAADGAGAIAEGTTPPVAILKAGAPVGALGSWNGMNYAVSTGTGDAKVTNEARVYTNKGPGKSKPFGEVHTGVIDTDGADKGYLPVDGTVAAEVARVMGTAFETDGTQTHTRKPRENAVFLRGTYDGAPGEYRCSGTADCTVTNDGEGSPSALAGTWHFKPDTGAMVREPDPEYLYYGWWVSKDEDDMPTAASAFTGVVEAAANELDRAWTGAWDPEAPAITGSATYAGNAVGKFAMNNPLDSTGNGGHFTADAMLEAKFSGTDPGVTGMIDNFRLNDGTEDPGWSVSLNDGAFGEGGAFAPVDDADTTDVNEGINNTVWSINGNKASATGAWSGTMYDEMPGTGPDGDGSNIPTTVTGSFYSEFSSIGRMVGAFGAEKK